MQVRKLSYMTAGALIFSGGYIPIIQAAEKAETQLTLQMQVVHITCLINDGTGINQQVYLPLTSQAELRAGTAKSALAKLMVDCGSSSDTPANITVSLTPAGGGTLVGSGVDGMLKTDLSGVALNIVWNSNGQPASLAPGNATVFTPSASDPLRWDLSLLVTPKVINGEKLGGGHYKSALQVKITYS
ncbi:fimbrial protein [Salmonella enterica subsp. enterica]|nr:fimbrial protein [Salmonella enterica subsp. enterica]